MNMNDGKSHLLMLGNQNFETNFNIYGSSIKKGDEEKLLVVAIDEKLNFKSMSIVFVKG